MKIELELLTGEKLFCSECEKCMESEVVTIVLSDKDQTVTDTLCQECADQ